MTEAGTDGLDEAQVAHHPTSETTTVNDPTCSQADSTVDDPEKEEPTAAVDAPADAALSYEEKLELEMEKAKTMKISELKMKLMAKGILTSTFCEKQEFVRAFAELAVKESEQKPTLGLATAKFTVSDDDDDEDDDDDDESDDDPDVSKEKLPAYLQQRLEKLRAINDEREELMKEYLVDRAKLEAKYRQLEQPLYKRRKDIVLGEMDEEIAKEHGIEEEHTEERAKGIPQFWVCALNQMPVTGELISEQDVDCLDRLEDITCSDFENGQGFKLEFHFAPNEYFENTVLTKSYDVPNLLLADEPILKNVQGCEINWKPGKCLTYAEVTKQQRGKGKNAGQIREVTTKVKTDSFFHFFTPPKLPSMESMDEQEAARLEAAFDEDYDAAQALRSHIIPKAVMWFAGDAMDKEMEAAMEGMQWPPGSEGQASGDENPECKQS